MPLLTGLTQNPNRKGVVSRVVILGEQDGQALVLDPGPIYNNPDILRPFNPSHALAIKVWKWAVVALWLVGIAASFLWHWWAFIPALLLAHMLYLANQKSAGQLGAQVFREHAIAAAEFQNKGILWFAASTAVLQRRA